MAPFSIAVAIRNIILDGRGTEYEDAPKMSRLYSSGKVTAFPRWSLVWRCHYRSLGRDTQARLRNNVKPVSYVLVV
jgi:hypothetical protein